MLSPLGEEADKDVRSAERIVVLKHVDAEWDGYQDLPEACRDEFAPDVTPGEITQAVSRIPTLFKITTPCHGALLLAAARKVVRQFQHRIVDFIEASQETKRP